VPARRFHRSDSFRQYRNDTPSVFNRTHAKQKFLSQGGIWRNCKTNYARFARANSEIFVAPRIIIAS
jgi:hypothetical protein